MHANFYATSSQRELCKMTMMFTPPRCKHYPGTQSMSKIQSLERRNLSFAMDGSKFCDVCCSSVITLLTFFILEISIQIVQNVARSRTADKTLKPVVLATLGSATRKLSVSQVALIFPLFWPPSCTPAKSETCICSLNQSVCITLNFSVFDRFTKILW